jgi:hypothetical protein
MLTLGDGLAIFGLFSTIAVAIIKMNVKPANGYRRIDTCDAFRGGITDRLSNLEKDIKDLSEKEDKHHHEVINTIRRSDR